MRQQQVAKTVVYRLAIIELYFPLSAENLVAYCSSYTVAWHYHLQQT